MRPGHTSPSARRGREIALVATEGDASWTDVARPVLGAASKGHHAHVKSRVCSTLPALQAMGSDWSDLLARCPGADLFMTPAWHLAWWKAFGAGRTPEVITLRDDTRLLAVIPLCRYRDRLRGLPVRVTGSYNNEHASRTGMLVEPGHEAAVAQALARHLHATADQWDVLMLRQLPVDAAWLRPFIAACKAIGLSVFGPTPGVGKCVLPLARGWAGYLAGKNHHYRSRLNENRRRLERSGQVNYRRSNGSARDFAEFEHLESRSWKREDDGARLGAVGWAFQCEVAMNIDAGMRCHNLFLEINGRVVGALHTVGYRGTAYSMQTLFDESARSLYPGRTQFAVHLADMFEDGRYGTLDLNGNSEFCRSWSEQELGFVDLQVYSRRPYSALLSHLKRLLGRHR